MADITLSWRSATVLRCAQRLLPRSFRTGLEQFDAEVFIGFISEKLGPVYYNAGIGEAIHRIWPGAAHPGRDGSEEDFIMPYLAGDQ